MDRKLIFDAVRRLLGRGFGQAEVAALDAAIDSALKPDSPDPVDSPRAVSAAGAAPIRPGAASCPGWSGAGPPSRRITVVLSARTRAQLGNACQGPPLAQSEEFQ